MPDLIEDVMNRLAGFGATDLSDSTVYKAWTTGSGLLDYNLELPAKSTYPVLTPLRNETERFVDGAGDIAVHWKTITAINPTQVPIGVSEGNRGGVIGQTLVDVFATYITWGLENYVTFQAQWGAQQFDDAVGRGTQELLEAVMIGEEAMMLGGNSSVALGTTNTPTGTGATTGGALSDGTYYVGVVALTLDGYRLATLTGGVVQQISRTNADGSTDTINGGTAQPSAQSASVTLSAGTAVQKITAHTTATRGAVAYAWYLGSSATHLYLQQITTINSVAFTTAYVTTTQDFTTLAAADYSKLLTYSFNGLLYQSGFDSTSNAYFKSLATGTDGVGTALTTDGAAGVTEINTALRYAWDNYRFGYDTLWVSAQEAESINKIVIAGGGAPLFRLNIDGTVANTITAGTMTGDYLNKYTQQLMKLRIHPNMPAGTMLFQAKRVPFPHPEFGNTIRMHLRSDYFQRQWPQRTLKYEFGVYADGVLQNYFTPGYGVICNIAPS